VFSVLTGMASVWLVLAAVFHFSIAIPSAQEDFSFLFFSFLFIFSFLARGTANVNTTGYMTSILKTAEKISDGENPVITIETDSS